MANERRNPNPGRIFWGLALILVGALILFQRFDFWDFGYLIADWWPAIFILIGISILIGNGFRRPGAGIFFVLFGTLFLLWNLGILRYDIWHHLWPAGLIVLGLWIILRPAVRRRDNPGEVPPVQGNDIDISAVFNGVKRRIDSRDFKGGEVTAVFGSADIDLTGAGLEGGKATLEATAIFGGIDIIVPRDWRIVNNGTPILGSFDQKHRNPSEGEAAATLYVRGTSIFGGVTIKN
jgi:predicted membrane protein